MSTTTRWKVRPFDRDRIEALARESGLSPLVAQLLMTRGVTDAPGARAFLEARLSALHDPGTLPGASEAADRLASAVVQGRKIVIYGDYDVDGVSSATAPFTSIPRAGA